MTCLCLTRVETLIGGLAPAASLRLGLPPVVASLAAVLSTPPAPTADLSISAALRLGLPQLPLPALMVDRIAATVTAVAQVGTHLGIDLLQAQGPGQLVLALQSLQWRMPALHSLLVSLKLDLASALDASFALSAIASARARLGIDLLAPGAALALKLALSATVAAPAPAPALPVPGPLALRIAAYARLGAAAASVGGVGRLLPALQVLARLQLPTLPWPLAPLASLSLLIGLRDKLRAVLGIDASMPGLQWRLQEALRPLWGLAALQLPALSAPAAALPALSASFALDASALAALDLKAIAALKLPDLAPLSLLASVSGAAGLASSDCCGGS